MKRGPDEIHSQHPYLPLSHIRSALAYCWDHQAEMDADIERRFLRAEEARKGAGPSPLAIQLKAKT